MDHYGIAMQILSVSAPRVQQVEAAEGTAWSKKINDELSAAVRQQWPRKARHLLT